VAQERLRAIGVGASYTHYHWHCNLGAFMGSAEVLLMPPGGQQQISSGGDPIFLFRATPDRAHRYVLKADVNANSAIGP